MEIVSVSVFENTLRNVLVVVVVAGVFRKASPALGPELGFLAFEALLAVAAVAFALSEAWLPEAFAC